MKQMIMFVIVLLSCNFAFATNDATKKAFIIKNQLIDKKVNTQEEQYFKNPCPEQQLLYILVTCVGICHEAVSEALCGLPNENYDYDKHYQHLKKTKSNK